MSVPINHKAVVSCRLTYITKEWFYFKTPHFILSKNFYSTSSLSEIRCPIPPNLHNAIQSSHPPYVVDSVASYTCSHTDHRFLDGRRERNLICSLTGSWQGALDGCEGKRCTYLISPGPGYCAYAGDTSWYFACYIGYIYRT